MKVITKRSICSSILLLFLSFFVHADNYDSFIFEDFPKIKLRKQNQDLHPIPSYQSVLGQFRPVVMIFSVFSNLETKEQRAFRCSATSIGFSFILTARHCIERKGFSLDYVVAVPDGDWSIRDSLGPHNLRDNSNFFYSKENQLFINSLSKRKRSSKVESVGSDVAIIELQRDISEYIGKYELLNYMQFTSIMKTSSFSMIGYPANGQKKGFPLNKYHSGPVCQVVGFKSNSIFTNCIPNPGISGSPLLLERNGDFFIAGVNSESWRMRDYGGRSYGSAYAGLEPIINFFENKNLRVHTSKNLD